jgi:hypothetical protein
MDAEGFLDKRLASHKQIMDAIASRKLVWHVKGEGFYFDDGTAEHYGPLGDDQVNASHSELVDSIYHLRDKSWFTPQHLEDFLELVEAHLGDPRNWGVE